ncbi:MAG TPA: hypothetical protein VD996_11490 [Chitinophagaceae bacterium]|nr:hypothetical protein [Chitinophagaceae bacterium]
MNQLDIQAVIDSVANISDKRQYWFVRTMSGKYYNDFVENGFIAIGYDRVPLFEISKANTKDKTGSDILAEIVKKAYPKEQRPAYIGNQLLDFAYNIKKGDIVLSPSVSSDLISIGRVIETPVYQEEIISEDPSKCPFIKRKKIKWLKTNLRFDKIDPGMLHLKYTRRTITSVDFYTAGLVDRLITPLFRKHNDAHLALNIEKQTNLAAVDLFETWLDLFALTEEFGKDHNIAIDRREFQVKINVQSPGTVEFISYSVIGIVILSTFVAAIVGAEFETNTRIFKHKFKSEGLLKQITNFLNNKSDRKFKEELRNKLMEMDVNPDEIVKILEQFNKNNN